VDQIAPDLWHIPGWPANAINCYVAGDTLIDARTKWDGKMLLNAIGDHPLNALALTHVHPDHQGACKHICEARNIPLACHADDVDGMEGRRPVQEAHPHHPLNIFFKYFSTGPPHEVDRVLNEGDEVAGFRVVHAPGHARGEVIFFRDSDRVAIAGDVCNNMNLITMQQRIGEPPEVFTLDPAENRRSIRKLAELNPSMICIGHGKPITDMGDFERFVSELPAD
jgi:hydroxyacylglutathione hydrolase